jgi:hypothetical protein
VTLAILVAAKKLRMMAQNNSQLRWRENALLNA